jgi:hypothetical protein
MQFRVLEKKKKKIPTHPSIHPSNEGGVMQKPKIVAQENCHFCGVLNPGACTRAEANRQLPLAGKATTNACGVGSRHPAQLQHTLVCVCVRVFHRLSTRDCAQPKELHTKGQADDWVAVACSSMWLEKLP